MKIDVNSGDSQTLLINCNNFTPIKASKIQ